MMINICSKVTKEQFQIEDLGSKSNQVSSGEKWSNRLLNFSWRSSKAVIYIFTLESKINI